MELTRTLLAFFLLAALSSTAGAQPTQGPYGAGPCPFAASSCIVKAPGGTTARTEANRANDPGFSVLETGALCDGSHDDTAAITAALTSGHMTVTVPENRTCYSLTGVTVPSGVTLQGGSRGLRGGNAYGSSIIECAAAVTNCVYGAGENNYSVTIRDLTVETDAALLSPTATCIYVHGGMNVHIEHVTVDRCAIGFYFYHYDFKGIRAFMDNDVGLNITDAYIVQDGYPELRISNSAFGGSTPSVAYIRVDSTSNTDGQPPNGLVLVNNQFNSSGGANSAQYFMEMKNCTACSPASFGVNKMLGNHIETISDSLFTTEDGTFTSIGSWEVVGNSFFVNGTLVANGGLFKLNVGTTLNQVSFVSNRLAIRGITVAPTDALTGVVMSDNRIDFYGAGLPNGISVTGVGASTMNFIGNHVAGNVTFDGAFTELATIGNSVSGVLTNSAMAPTVSAACTSPSVTASNGPEGFRFVVGTSCSGIKTGTLGLPIAAPNYWVCNLVAITASGVRYVAQTGGTNSTVTFASYSRTTGAATDFSDNDVVRGSCHPF